MGITDLPTRFKKLSTMTLISMNNLFVKAINVSNVPADTIGEVHFMDLAGKYYVKWDNGYSSVIQERGETFSIVEKKVSKPKNLFWYIKNYFINLLK